MKKVKNDLTGQRFGRLKVIGVDDRNTRKTYFLCECDCGTVKSIRSDGLLSGAVKSCGCLKREQDEINLDRTTHNMSSTRLYQIWQGMRGRCYNKHDPRYERYGGRGITVCDEWREFARFCEWSKKNGYQDNLTIDRINNDEGYRPDNCRWATNETQANNRESNIKITIGNSERTLTQWCEIFRVDYRTTLSRYNRNGFLSIDDLFNR